MRTTQPRPDRAPLLQGCVAVAIAVLLSGCATMQPPKPWEKGQLARPEMQFDADRMNARLADHIYTSKEAASGGVGVGGGGCGCN
jgi:anti-sigma factor RsiW